MWEDRLGYLWVGSWRGGLDCLDPLTGRSRRFQYQADDPDSLASNTVTFIRESEDGGLWIGTRGGLNYIDRSLQISRVPLGEGQQSRLMAMLQMEDAQGLYLWLATIDNGLSQFRPKSGALRQKTLAPPQQKEAQTIYALLASERGSFWAASAGAGLFKLDASGDILERFAHDPQEAQSICSSFVVSLAQIPGEEDRFLWAGTRSGLARLDLATHKFQNWSTLDGLINDTIYAILVDERGWLWMSTNDGLARFDPLRGQFNVYTRQDGLPMAEFNNLASGKGRDGRFFFGGVQGLVGFYPRDLGSPAPPTRLAITNISVSQEHIPLGRIAQNSSGEKQLNLNHSGNMVSFEFASLDFSRTHFKRYHYQMEGWDPGWIETNGNHRLATYTHLKSGAYRFRIKGTNRDGVLGRR